LPDRALCRQFRNERIVRISPTQAFSPVWTGPVLVFALAVKMSWHAKKGKYSINFSEAENPQTIR
jgi:hypothetical protein